MEIQFEEIAKIKLRLGKGALQEAIETFYNMSVSIAELDFNRWTVPTYPQVSRIIKEDKRGAVKFSQRKGHMYFYRTDLASVKEFPYNCEHPKLKLKLALRKFERAPLQTARLNIPSSCWTNHVAMRSQLNKIIRESETKMGLHIIGLDVVLQKEN